MATRNHVMSGPAPGEDVRSPTRASKPAGETYKSPVLYRGSAVNAPRSDISGYAANGWAGPSSVGVEQSGGPRASGLGDVSFAPDDAVKAALASHGMDDKSGEIAKPTADLQRKISTANVADHAGMGSNRARQSGGVESLKSKSLPNKIGASTGEPVRQPPPGGKMPNLKG